MSKEKTKQSKTLWSIAREYSQAFIGALFLAILIRGFLFEPFKIPSGSMIPTLLEGDHIFVARYKYGLRIPFTKTWLAEFDDPKRGDVIVFTYPHDESENYIKRVIGLPGDTVSMEKGVLKVNGKPVAVQNFYTSKRSDDNQCTMELSSDSEALLSDDLKKFPFYLKHDKFQQSLESIDGEPAHMIQYVKKGEDDFELTSNDLEFTEKVPDRMFFVMGDNRDRSRDSRAWGFVPRENLKGKAVYIWLSLDQEGSDCPNNIWPGSLFPNIRWNRFGRDII